MEPGVAKIFFAEVTRLLLVSTQKFALEGIFILVATPLRSRSVFDSVGSGK